MWQNTYHKERISYMRDFLQKIDEDPDKKKRLEKQECKVCFYQTSRIAGQSFTSTECSICDKEITHGNTDVDRLCQECAKAANLCKHCGADIEYKNRRKYKGING